MKPEGTVDDDTDTDGGMPDEAEDEDESPTKQCVPVADVLRAPSESLPE